MPDQDPIPPLRWARELPYLLIPVAFAVTVRLACLPYAEAFWDADGATSCLLALHHAQGKMPAFWFSQDYNGSIEGLIAAPFVAVMGTEVTAMAAAMTLLAALLTAAIYWVGRSFAGPWGGVLGALPYAAAPLPLVDNLSGINHSYTMMSLLGVLILWLGRAFLAAPSARGAFWLGLAIGTTVFNNPQGVSFVAPLALAILLRGRAIPRLLGRDGVVGARRLWPRLLVGAPLLALIGMVGLAATGVGGVELGPIVITFSKHGKHVMRLVLATVAALVLLELALGNRRWLLALAGSALVGALIGQVPAIAFKVHNAMHDIEVVGTPAGIDPTYIPQHARMLYRQQAGEILLNQLPHGKTAAPAFPADAFRWLRGAAWVVLLAMLGGLLVVRRRDWADALCLRPPARVDMGWLLAFHAFAVLAMYLMLPRSDVYPKYLQAGLVPLAGLVAACWRWARLRAPALAVAGAVVWVAVYAGVATRSAMEVRGRWQAEDAEWREVRLAIAELDARGVTAGYANYWFGFKVNFLSGERIILREWPEIGALGWPGQRPMLPEYHRRVDRAMARGENLAFIIDKAGSLNFDEQKAREWFEKSWRDKRIEVYDHVDGGGFDLYFCRPKPIKRPPGFGKAPQGQAPKGQATKDRPTKDRGAPDKGAPEKSAPGK